MSSLVPISKQISPELLAFTYGESEKFIEFLKIYKGPNNDKSGKYSMGLDTINNLFKNSSWVNQNKKGGHTKFEHPITKIVVEYSAHKNPVDPGAVETIAEQVQLHINKFFVDCFGKSPRCREGTNNKNRMSRPDFVEVAAKINAPHQN